MFRIKLMIIVCSLACGQVTMPAGHGDAALPDSGDGASDAADAADAAPPDGSTIRVPGCPAVQTFELSWGTPVKMSMSDTQYRELWPSISCDDKELYYTRVWEGGYIRKLYVARRGHRGEPWSLAVPVEAGGENARDPEIAPGGKELYYNTETDLFVLRRDELDAPWVESTDTFRGRSPAVSGDGLTLYYIDSWDGYKLMRRRRSDLQADWGSSETVMVPNGWRYQQVTVSPDGTTLLLFQPPDASSPRVVALRDSTWMELPALASAIPNITCDLSWHGDLICSDTHDLFYIPNTK
jgi:hypothetical protein